MSAKAVLYLRSSKDRHDVSIDAQRDELRRVAKTRGLHIVDEFVDVVESAKDEHRPAFQGLRGALKQRERGWTVVLLLEPSRLSRNQFVAHWFTHDAKQHGVTIVYARMPEANPMVDMIVIPLMHGFAEYHSWESKQKGLAGMTENVKRGFRAGGRAPTGYRLKHEATGALRDGEAVTKSKLEPDTSAPAVAEYLKQRAAGVPRRTAKRKSGLTLKDTTLIGMEWNALTYAGATVWNVHAERERGRAIGGTKRRPRAEWVIKEDTHEALISHAEAGALLQRLEHTAAGRRDRAPAAYLLAGMLQAPDGDAWHGCRDRDARYYRLRGGSRRRVNAEPLERAVVRQVEADFKSPRFVDTLVQGARRLAQPTDAVTAIERAYTAITGLDRKIARLTEALAEGVERPILEQIKKFEAEREGIRVSIIDSETRLHHARAISGITERDVRAILGNLSNDMESLDAGELRDFLRGRIGRITMDPANLQCRIHYEIPAISGDKLASPRGFEPRLPP